MAETTFFEIIFQARDFAFGGRDEIEEPLDEALEKAGIGEVTGGGSGLGIANIDVEVVDPEVGLSLIRKVLVELGVAPSTVIKQYSPSVKEHKVYE